MIEERLTKNHALNLKGQKYDPVGALIKEVFNLGQKDYDINHPDVQYNFNKLKDLYKKGGEQ